DLTLGVWYYVRRLWMEFGVFYLFSMYLGATARFAVCSAFTVMTEIDIETGMTFVCVRAAFYPYYCSDYSIWSRCDTATTVLSKY
ncbi:hypothetical protein BGW80DRAFT_1343112, partial [Lactifluus volemus]